MNMWFFICNVISFLVFNNFSNEEFFYVGFFYGVFKGYDY